MKVTRNSVDIQGRFEKELDEAMKNASQSIGQLIKFGEELRHSEYYFETDLVPFLQQLINDDRLLRTYGISLFAAEKVISSSPNTKSMQDTPLVNCSDNCTKREMDQILQKEHKSIIIADIWYLSLINYEVWIITIINFNYNGNNGCEFHVHYCYFYYTKVNINI